MNYTAQAADALVHACRKIREADPVREPYRHIRVEGLFPREYYHQLHLNARACREALVPLETEAGLYENKLQLDFIPDPVVPGAVDGKYDNWEAVDDATREFWYAFRRVFLRGQALRQRIRYALEWGGDSFNHRLPKEWSEPYWAGRLALDLEGAGLGPHIDRADKLASCVIYLADGSEPADLQMKGSTFLLKAKERFRSEVRNAGAAHLGYEWFDIDDYVAFKPNSMIAWAVGPGTYHAFETPADLDRWNLKLFIQDRKRLEEAKAEVVATASQAHDWKR